MTGVSPTAGLHPDAELEMRQVLCSPPFIAAPEGLFTDAGSMRPGPKRQTRGEVDAAQRERLFQATVETVAEVGYAGLTVAHVTHRAGVSRKTFYELFKDRDECFLRTYELGLEHVRTLVVDSYREGASRVEGARAALATLLGFLDVERGWARLLILEALTAGGRAVAIRVQMIASLAAELERLYAEDGLSQEALPLAGEVLVGGSIWTIHCHLLQRPRESLIQLHGPLMALMMLPYPNIGDAHEDLTQSLE